jgi:hypothetical protein
MDESLPFLSKTKSKATIGGKNSHCTRRCHSCLFCNNVTSACTHSAVFIVTSIFWACFLLLLDYRIPKLPTPPTAPSYHKSPFYHEISTSTSHDNSFLATEVEYLTCGDSLAEAKRRNCTYDILSNAWIPGKPLLSTQRD